MRWTKRSRPGVARSWRIWPIGHFDGVVVHASRGSGHVSPHTIYVALGVNLEGEEDLLGSGWRKSIEAKFWLHALTDMTSRGLNNIFVACVDSWPSSRSDSRGLPADQGAALVVVYYAGTGYVNAKDVSR